MKILVLGVIILLLLGAGGAGGYFYFQNSAVASLGDASEEAVERKEAEEHAALSAEEEAKLLRFVQLDPILLPIIDGYGVNQVVTISVSLEVKGDANEEYVRHLIPRLKDAYIQDLYGELNRHATMEGGAIKIGDLKQRLNAVSKEILGEKTVNNVLLQVVNQRPI